MSIFVMTAIWKTCLFQGNTLNVLLAMADFADDDGGDIFPGIELLAGKCRTSVRTTQVALRELEASRAVEQIAGGRGGRGRATEYRIDLERVQELQGLHRAEMPDCEHCLAKKRSADKRAEHRAKRVQVSAGKGADLARKGADFDQKGADSSSRIDNNRQQPSDIHQHSPAAQAAGASGNIASLGTEGLQQWPVFRSVISANWPDGFPYDNEAAAKAEFARQTRKHRPEILVECARLHGEEMTERQSARSRSAGKILMKTPSNWLRSGDWQGYQSKIRERDAAEGLLTRAIGNVARAVGPDLFDYLRNGLGMSDEMIARLDGIELETGPPPLILVKSALARLLIDKHQFRLQRRLGDGLEIRLVATSPPKSSTAPN